MIYKIDLVDKSREDLEEGFAAKFSITVEMFEKSLYKVGSNMDYLLHPSYSLVRSLFDPRFLFKFAPIALNNILKYISEFEILFTEIDHLKIINELHQCCLQELEDDSLFTEFRENDYRKEEISEIKTVAIRLIWLTVLEIYVDIIYNEKKRKLHKNNFHKMIAIIGKDKTKDFYSEKGLYYIFRNILDFDSEDTELPNY